MASTGSRQPSHQIRLPLRFPDGTTALVSELTPSGMYVQTRAPLYLSEVVTLELRPAQSTLIFTAEGIVVAVDARKPRGGVRVRFTSLRIADAS